MKRVGLTIALLSLLAAGLVACGGDDDTTSAETTTTEQAAGGGGGGEAVKVSADANGDLAFDQKSLTANAGAASFDFDNPSSTTHDFCIEGSGNENLGCTDQISDSKAKLAVSDLKPGEYTFYC